MEDKGERAKKLQNVTISTLTNPQKAGFLTKQGGRKQNWRKRYCILHDGTLYYFKNQKAVKLPPKGSIDLESASLVGETAVKKKFAFQITTSKRTFYIFADNEDNKKSWMGAINKSILDLKKGGGSDSKPDTPMTKDTPKDKPAESNGGEKSPRKPDAASSTTTTSTGTATATPAKDNDTKTTDTMGNGTPDKPDNKDTGKDTKGMGATATIAPSGGKDNMTPAATTTTTPATTTPKSEGGHDRPRDKLARAKETIPFLGRDDSKVVEFWQIWSESFPPVDGLTANTAIEFEVSTSLSMEKLKWRTCGPQNMFIQRMVDFFFDVGASESEIDRLNNVGALIEPAKIGSWIEMSDKQGMDGGWYFPVEMPAEKAILAADAGEAIEKVKKWVRKHDVDTCFSVGRDMGAMPPRQTSMKVQLPGSNEQQLNAALDAFTMFDFPMPSDEIVSVLRTSTLHSGPLFLNIITCSEGFVQIGILTPRPTRAVIAQLCELTKSPKRNELEKFEKSLGCDCPAYCEYQHLMKSFGYGVYKEGFDVILHYHVGEERSD